MPTSDTSDFYTKLPLNTVSVSNLVANETSFARVPANWYVLVADIKNSTQAIQNGKHNEVNLVATGSIIAILNLTINKDYNVPFFFGGDGAVMLIPPDLLEAAISALEKHSANTLKSFGFELKTGHLQVQQIYDVQIELKIARCKVNENLTIPVVLGNGLHYAENLIKEMEAAPTSTKDVILNLNGMECKWDKVKPPLENQEVLSLLVRNCEGQKPSVIYSKVLKAIDDIYGSPKRRRPISVEKLKLKAGLRKIRNEMKAKLGKFNFIYLMKNWFRLSFGEYYLRNTESGKNYLKAMVELTDNLSIDGRINTVITGTVSQRKSLVSYLDKLEKTGKLRYGYHVSRESVISCYVRDISSNQHIHFVDGSGGGYTKAANMLKEKKLAQTGLS